MPHGRAAPFKQTREQAAGLGLGAIEQDVAAADTHGSKVDITSARLPRRGRAEQRGHQQTGGGEVREVV